MCMCVCVCVCVCFFVVSIEKNSVSKVPFYFLQLCHDC